MNHLLSFWNSLTGNSVLLLVIMPVVGALLVRIMATFGRESCYFTALTNVWLTTGLGVILLFRFEADEQQHPTAPPYTVHVGSSVDWLGTSKPVLNESSEPGPTTYRTTGPDIRFSIGCNRLALWPILVIVATTLACLSAVSVDDPKLVSRISWLLVTESALIGTFAAQDIVLLAFFLELSAFGLFFLAGLSSGLHYREAARRFFWPQLVSSVLLVIGLTGLAIAQWWMRHTPSNPNPSLTFSIPGIVNGIPELAYSTESARGYWDAMSPWLFTLLVSGLALRVQLAPLHSGWMRLVDHCDRRVLAMAAAGCLPFGFHAAARLIVPTFPDLIGEIGFRVMMWSVTATVALSLMSITASTSRRRIGLGCLAAFSTAFGITFLDHPLAVHGGLLLTVGASSAAAVLFLIVPSPPAGGEGGRRPDEGGFGERGQAVSRVLLRAVVVLACAGLAWLPLSGSFFGAILAIQAVFNRNTTAAFWLIGSILCLAITATQLLRSEGIGRPQQDRPRLPALVPLVAILITIALVPAVVMGPAN